jgi:glutathione synthase/RimK-type ligase-like ATP-grasp enzyme
LVTCKKLPEPDPDEEPLLKALRDDGLSAELLAWDDPGGEPGRFDLCVLRSCWNYYADTDGFLSWIDNAAQTSRVLNPPSVIHWNLHKRYLIELEQSGVATVPTAWFDRGASVDLRQVMEANRWGDVVLKPAISASSFRTERFGSERATEGQVFLDALIRDSDVMVQQYIPAQSATGERALVWIDGEWTHAVRKNPRFAGGVERVSDAIPVSIEEQAIADRALSLVEERLLYARVDVMADPDGRLLVSELELMEPSLFLLQLPRAMSRFVAAIHRECESR